MRVTIVVGILAAMAARAAADDRGPVLDVEGAAGFVVPSEIGPDVAPDQAGVGIARAMVSWQRPRIPLPAERGTADFGADIAPELGVGFIGNDRRGDAFAQVGLRLHVGYAQNAMGLLGISAQGGLWLAARAGVVGGEQNTMIEGDFGWYLWLGQTKWRIGWEMGALGVRNPTDNGVAMPLYSTEPKDVTAIMHVALFVGTQL